MSAIYVQLHLYETKGIIAGSVKTMISVKIVILRDQDSMTIKIFN